MMKNPMISKVRNTASSIGYGGDIATYGGVAAKTFGLVVLVALSAVATWMAGYATPVTTGVTAVMGLITCLAISFKPDWAGFLAPLYAILEGMCLACVSFLLNAIFPGIVLSAVMLTFGVALAAAVLYAKGVVKVTSGFVKVTMAALFGILFAYLIEFALGLFGINFPLMHQGGMMGIAINLLVVGVAAMCLFIDYEQINQSVSAGLPKEAEWYCAFSLLVTLVWLYIEILDLLKNIASSDD